MVTENFVFYCNVNGDMNELLIEAYADGERSNRFRYTHHDCRRHNSSLKDYNVGLTFTGFLEAIGIWDSSAEALIKCANLWHKYVDFCASNNCILIDDFIFVVLTTPIMPYEKTAKTIVNISDPCFDNTMSSNKIDI